MLSVSNLSAYQQRILAELSDGAVIGETDLKPRLSYELFIRRKAWRPLTTHPLENPFLLHRIPKQTVFTLLSLGLIEERTEIIRDSMTPFCRDVWYGVKFEQTTEND